MKRIIAIGGGAFSAKTPRPKFDQWLLAQTAKRRPSVCFIPTACGDSAATIRRIEATLKRLGARPSTLALYAAPTEDLTKLLSRQDLIFVGGGNTYNMLALWRLWKLDVAVRRAYERGVILSGSSAGGLCWFASGLTDSFPGRYDRMSCLGWLRGSFSPHFDSESGRRPIYRKMIRTGKLPAGYAVDDAVALEFVDGRFKRAVTSRRSAGALHIGRRGSKLIEAPVAIERI